MSDDSVCPDCGESFASEHAVSVHQGQSSCGNTEANTEWTELEQRVLDRDDGVCKRCENADATVVHEIDDDDRVEREIVNYAALCQDCDDYVTGLASVTKRTVIEAGVDDSEDKPWYARNPTDRRHERRRR